MASRDPRIDAYIARSAPFAQPILRYLRAVVHEACPQVEETLKWSAPSFVHAGGILCMMAAFKQHASFGFWRHALVVGEDTPRDGMGSYGKLTGPTDLPPKKTLIADIRNAMRLNEQGARLPRVRRAVAPRPPPVMSPDLAAALHQNPKAQATFDGFAPSHRREYIDWILDAKRPETRARRIGQAVEWMAEGKPRNWKYMKC